MMLVSAVSPIGHPFRMAVAELGTTKADLAHYVTKWFSDSDKFESPKE